MPNKQKKSDDGKFSYIKLLKIMGCAGVIGGAVGVIFSWRSALFGALILAILAGISYCEQFDD